MTENQKRERERKWQKLCRLAVDPSHDFKTKYDSLRREFEARVKSAVRLRQCARFKKRNKFKNKASKKNSN